MLFRTLAVYLMNCFEINAMQTSRKSENNASILPSVVATTLSGVTALFCFLKYYRLSSLSDKVFNRSIWTWSKRNMAISMDSKIQSIFYAYLGVIALSVGALSAYEIYINHYNQEIACHSN